MDKKAKEHESMMSKSAESCETCGRYDGSCSDCGGCVQYSRWIPKSETEKERVDRRIKTILAPGAGCRDNCDNCADNCDNCADNCDNCAGNDIGRFAMCVSCKHNGNGSKCISCDGGRNFEPEYRDDSCANKEQHYRKNSVVSSRKKEIGEMVTAHWNYVSELIKSGADTSRQFSFDEVMKMRKWDYTSAARHFYGHGFEDGQGAMAEKTLDRLKEA